MIKVQNIKLPIAHGEGDILNALVKKLGCGKDRIKSFELFKKSIDSRKKPDIFYVCTFLVSAEDE